MRKHQLLPKELEKNLPSFEEDQDVPFSKKVVHLKFFSPYSNWTWYVTSYEEHEKVFFGLVKGFEDEWGYFSLEELEAAKVRLGPYEVPAIERDLYFSPKTVSELAKEGEIPENVVYS